MPDLLYRDTRTEPLSGGDELLARAELRRQIGRLERQLAAIVAEAFPRFRVDARVPAASSEPRALGLGELESVRDALAAQVADGRRALEERAQLETANRELLERMLAAPEQHKWLRISRADVGEPGCGHWHSRPHLGPLGMLMGWWRVKVSSGCPLSGRLAAVLSVSQLAPDKSSAATFSELKERDMALRDAIPRRRDDVRAITLEAVGAPWEACITGGSSDPCRGTPGPGGHRTPGKHSARLQRRRKPGWRIHPGRDSAHGPAGRCARGPA